MLYAISKYCLTKMNVFLVSQTFLQSSIYPCIPIINPRPLSTPPIHIIHTTFQILAHFILKNHTWVDRFGAAYSREV